MEIRPITFKAASKYITDHHRHHKRTIGCKFRVSCWDDDRLCGVAVCGRPVSRALDNGEILEINRVCTDGTKNACSMLYGACCRVAKRMGYKKVITYILASENGASLRRSNFTDEGEAGNTEWFGKRQSGKDVPHEKKRRYSRML